MSNLLKSKFILGVMVLGAFVVAGVASAYTPSGTLLKMGVSGTAVTEYQTALNTMTTCKVGASLATGYYGSLTVAATKCFQAANNLAVDGVAGAITQGALAAKSVMTGNFPAGCTSAAGFSTTTGMSCAAGPSTGLPAGCSTTAGYSPLTGTKCDSTGPTTPTTGGPLMGGAGSITVEDSSQFSSEEVGEGDEDVEILEFSVEADDESDVEVTSIKVELVQGTAADSEDLTDYAESVSIWFGGEMVGEADAEDFSENSDIYTKSISLDGAIVRAGDEEDFVVAITALGNLDSGDIDTDAWTVDVLNVRFEDAEGVVTTEDTDADTLEQSFDFASFATATDAELNVSLNGDDDDINEAHVINVDNADDTDDVEILSFTLEAEGDSDLNVTEIPVLITTTGETDESVIVIDAKLWLNDEQIGETEDVAAGGAVTFDDLDFDIEAGDTADLIVTVSLQDTDGALDDGDTVKAELTSTQVDAIEAEDESGEELVAADLTGTAAGEAHVVYDVGIDVTLVSADAEVDAGDVTGTNDHDLATFTFEFTVEAFDGDIYVDNTDPALTGGGTAHDLTLTGSGTVVDSDITSDATEGTDGFLVEEGTSETFEITVVITPTADGLFKLELGSVLYATSDIDGTIDYTFNLDDFETESVYLNNDAA